MGHLLESVMFYGKVINRTETYQMLRENIAATSLKIIWKNIYAVNVMLNQTSMYLH